MRRALREPLVHFLLLGGVIYVASLLWSPSPTVERDSRAPVVVTEALRAHLADRHEVRTGEAPSDETLGRLVTEWAETEVLLREARRLGLDQGDGIVERRLIQMMEFTLESQVGLETPTERDLADWRESHRARYLSEASYTFEHRFFVMAEGAEERAQAVLDAGPPEGGSVEADSFLHGSDFNRTPATQVSHRFGDAFLESLAGLTMGAWSSPIQSAYGWHLVRLQTAHPPALPPLDAIRSRVMSDLMEERRRLAREDALRALLSSYGVHPSPARATP